MALSLCALHWENEFNDYIFFPLALTQVMKHGAARFRAFGNMADVLMKMGKADEAISIYQKQLGLSKQSRDKRFEASAYGSLGVCHRISKQFDKSLGYHTQVSSYEMPIIASSGFQLFCTIYVDVNFVDL